MRWLSETKAIGILASIRVRFKGRLEHYEANAKNCAECRTPGACCLDEHFVNVRISRLEAAAIANSISGLSPVLRDKVIARTQLAATKFDLESDPAATKFFACPLYERGHGCLVHKSAKPLPCIAHACYERREDLPPERLLAEAEEEVNALNRRVYGPHYAIEPIPLALVRRFGSPANTTP